jgi:hypothetical protein
MMPEKMSFKGFTWPQNPRVLRVERQRELRELFSPRAGGQIQDLGLRCREVTGEGCFWGEAAAKQFQTLDGLLQQGGEGMLAVPGLEPFPAQFYRLRMLREPGPDCIHYAFSFLESAPGAAEETEGTEWN